MRSTTPTHAREFERHGFFRKASWDFFSGSTGGKPGYILNISRGGCLLKASEPIEHRRWIRIMIHDHYTNLSFTQVGRVVRREDIIESLESLDLGDGYDITLHRYGIEFTRPSALTSQADLILALSSKNLSVRSCLSLNSKSSFLPGSWA